MAERKVYCGSDGWHRSYRYHKGPLRSPKTPAKVAAAMLRVGDRVAARIRGRPEKTLREIGVVEEIDGEFLFVRIGSTRRRVAKHNCEAIRPHPEEYRG